MKKLFFGLLLGLFSTALAQAPEVMVSDVRAGEDAPLRIGGLLSGEKVNLQLSRPDNTKIAFAVTADDRGVAHTTIYGLHVQQKGDYRLQVVRREVGGGATMADFSVRAASVSAFRSTIVVDDPSAPGDGKGQIPFVVSLKDAFGNPVSGQSVQVFSSRNKDLLQLQQQISDHQGQVRGIVRSAQPGVSVLSALVGETMLHQRQELVFVLPESVPVSVGSDDQGGFGKLLQAQLFDESASQTVAYFTLEGLDSEVPAEKNLTVKVAAKDENGVLVKDYSGTVRFSSTDDRAQLPSDYQFTPEDQGAHTFFLAVTFVNFGTQTLAVNDINDFRIAGEQQVTVLSGSAPVDVPLGNPITITSPQPGAYQTLRVTITGDASACTNVKLVDGPTVLVGALSVDQTGSFVYQTPTLGEGIHEFQALCSDDPSLTSQKVRIQVDRTPPQNLVFKVDPEGGVDPGTKVQINVQANEPLSASQCVFGGQLTELDPTASGAFFGLLDAPFACGEYPVSCVARDLLGNESQDPEATVIRVCKPGEFDGQINTLPPEPEPEIEENSPPTAISNLSAEPGEGRVTLYWSPASDDTGISHYIIEFTGLTDEEALGGASENLLFDQINQTPDDRTQWYVDGLEDGLRYFFRVIAVDNEGLQGPPSQAVEASTLYTLRLTLDEGEELDETGTPSFWIPLLAFVGGFGVVLALRKS